MTTLVCLSATAVSVAAPDSYSLSNGKKAQVEVHGNRLILIVKGGKAASAPDGTYRDPNDHAIIIQKGGTKGLAGQSGSKTKQGVIAPTDSKGGKPIFGEDDSKPIVRPR